MNTKVLLKQLIIEAMNGVPLYRATSNYSTTEPFDISILEDNDIKDISTKRQKANGTMMLLDGVTGVKYSLHANGYIRKYDNKGNMWPISGPRGGENSPTWMVKMLWFNIAETRKKFERANNAADVISARTGYDVKIKEAGAGIAIIVDITNLETDATIDDVLQDILDAAKSASVKIKKYQKLNQTSVWLLV